MKKVLLLLIVLLLVGCKGDSKEIVKFKINENEKLVFKITDDDVYKFIIDGKFLIYKDDKEFVDYNFLYQDDCNSIIASETNEMIEKKDNGFIYKDTKYHYLHDSGKGVCIVINSDNVDKLQEILQNIEIKVIEEK